MFIIFFLSSFVDSFSSVLFVYLSFFILSVFQQFQQ